MGKYIIVQFESDGTIEMIPDKWFIETECEKSAVWPCWQNERKIVKAIAAHATPSGDDWLTFAISRVFAEADTYEAALKKLEIAKNDSEVEEEYSRSENKHFRQRRHKKIIKDYGLSESTDADAHVDKPLRKSKLFSCNCQNDFPLPPSEKKQLPLSSSSISNNVKKRRISNDPDKEDNENKKSMDHLLECFSGENEDEMLLTENYSRSNGPTTNVIVKHEVEHEDFVNDDVKELYEQTENITQSSNSNGEKKSELKIKSVASLAKYIPKVRSMSTHVLKEKDTNSQAPIKILNGNPSKQDLLNLNKNERFLFMAGMLTKILKTQAELKVRNSVCRNPQRSQDISYEDVLKLRVIFPFGEYTAFKNFNEETLVNDENCANNVKSYLRRIGGNCGHRVLRAMLNTIMTDELAIKFNFEGRRGKDSFKQLTIWNIIVDIAYEQDKTYNRKQAEKTASDWLKQAKKRIGDAAKKNRENVEPPLKGEDNTRNSRPES